MASRCTQCSGRKIIRGVGGMRKECPTCKGIGFVKDIESKQASNEDMQQKETTVIVKKRGRPKKEL